MKITELDLKTNGKRYKCGSDIFMVKDGDLINVVSNIYQKDLCIPIAELLEMEFEEIKEVKNPYTRVNPGKRYYFKNEKGEVDYLTDDICCFDYDQFINANYFNNRNYAEYIAFKETLMRKLDKFAWEHNARVIDWNNSCSVKYYISFSIDDNEAVVDWSCGYQSNNVYFTSKEIAEKAIEEFKDDLIKLYTWKFDF